MTHIMKGKNVRQVLIMSVVLTLGLIYGCVQSDASRMQDSHSRPPGPPVADPAYDEGQRSQELEGNTR